MTGAAFSDREMRGLDASAVKEFISRCREDLLTMSTTLYRVLDSCPHRACPDIKKKKGTGRIVVLPNLRRWRDNIDIRSPDISARLRRPRLSRLIDLPRAVFLLTTMRRVDLKISLVTNRDRFPRESLSSLNEPNPTCTRRLMPSARIESGVSVAQSGPCCPGVTVRYRYFASEIRFRPVTSRY